MNVDVRGPKETTVLSIMFVCRPSAFAVARKASLIAQGTPRRGGEGVSFSSLLALAVRSSYEGRSCFAGLHCHRSVRLQRCQRACKPVAAVAGGPEQQIVSDLVSRYLILQASCCPDHL